MLLSDLQIQSDCSKVRKNQEPQLVVCKFGGNNTMVLGSQSETYDTRYEHESSIRYLGFGLHLLNDGFDSCFLSFTAHS